jgi:hypothetical protein
MLVIIRELAAIVRLFEPPLCGIGLVPQRTLGRDTRRRDSDGRMCHTAASRSGWSSGRQLPASTFEGYATRPGREAAGER